MRITFALLGMTILFAASSAPAADETYLLQQKSVVGQVRQFDSEVHRDHVRTTTVSGVARPQVEEKSDSYFKSTVTAVEVEDGSLVAAKIHVDPQARTVTTLPTGQEQTDKSPLADATFTIRRDKDNKFTSDYKGELTDADWGALKPILTPGSVMFPDHAIAVGTQWSPTPEDIRPFLTVGPDDDVSETCKLEAVRVENDHHIAEITITVKETRHLALNVQVDVKDVVTLHFDIDDGRTVSAKSHATGTISTPPTAAIQVKGTIDDSSESQSVILPAGSASATTAPATEP